MLRRLVLRVLAARPGRCSPSGPPRWPPRRSWWRPRCTATGGCSSRQRARPPALAGRWELPGGRVEPGESEPDAVGGSAARSWRCRCTVTGRLGTDLPIAAGVLRVHVAELAPGAPEPRAAGARGAALGRADRAGRAGLGRRRPGRGRRPGGAAGRAESRAARARRQSGPAAPPRRLGHPATVGVGMCNRSGSRGPARPGGRQCSRVRRCPAARRLPSGRCVPVGRFRRAGRGVPGGRGPVRARRPGGGRGRRPSPARSDHPGAGGRRGRAARRGRPPAAAAALAAGAPAGLPGRRPAGRRRGHGSAPRCSGPATGGALRGGRGLVARPASTNLRRRSA